MKAWLRGVEAGGMDVRPNRRQFVQIDKEWLCDFAFCSAF
jgi:hypothetical protein